MFLLTKGCSWRPKDAPEDRRIFLGTQGCSWGLKDAPGDRRMLLGTKGCSWDPRMLQGTQGCSQAWARGGCLFFGWQWRLDGSPPRPQSGSPSSQPPPAPLTVLRVPSSPPAPPLGRSLPVNRMSLSALACSLASVSCYGRFRGTRGGKVTSDSPSLSPLHADPGEHRIPHHPGDPSAPLVGRCQRRGATHPSGMGHPGDQGLV